MMWYNVDIEMRKHISLTVAYNPVGVFNRKEKP